MTGLLAKTKAIKTFIYIYELTKTYMYLLKAYVCKTIGTLLPIAHVSNFFFSIDSRYHIPQMPELMFYI